MPIFYFLDPNLQMQQAHLPIKFHHPKPQTILLVSFHLKLSTMQS